jgi:hypothetical protein
VSARAFPLPFLSLLAPYSLCCGRPPCSTCRRAAMTAGRCQQGTAKLSPALFHNRATLQPLHTHRRTPKRFTRKRAPHRATTFTMANHRRRHEPALPPQTPPEAAAQSVEHRPPRHDELRPRTSPARPIPARPVPCSASTGEPMTTV